MSFEISAFLYNVTDKYVISRRNAELRRAEKKVCKAHPEWSPLTKEERTRINPRDRFGYMFYKNMAPGAGPLSYFVTDAPYTTELLPRLNPINHRANSFGMNTEFSDKNYAGLLMSGMSFPKAVIRRIHGRFFDAERRPITEAEALALLRAHDELVFKQTIGGYHGHGIRLVSAADYEDVYLSHGPDYVAQERVRQHETFARFNPSSVNVLRVTSLCWKGEVYILGGILRAGAPGAFCDHENKDGKTYLSIPLAEDGTILPRACDVDFGHVYSDCHGLPICGQIPRYEDIKALVRQEHSRWPHYGLIGWDITVDENDNIVCMEFNTKFPGLTGTQAALGPVLAQKSVRGVPLYEELMGK
ncbi:MAG: sugar-transfer associated ATP-grasp domain-containing protein [Oscillospiraceae bacterium]